MFRTLSIAGITAIALAAAPQAQARSNFDNFLLGATAIAILGIAANQSKARPAPVTHPYEPPRHNQHRQPVQKTQKHIVIQKKNKTVYKDVYITRVAKPKHCLRQRWTNSGWVTYYGKQCIAKYNQNYDYSFNR